MGRAFARFGGKHVNKTLLAILAVALLPTTLAHAPAGTPNPACNSAENPHDYLGAGDYNVGGYGAGLVTVQDGCPSPTGDGDFEFGLGGAFLPADHHSGTVCVDDVVLGPAVQFIVGGDANGNGLLEPGETIGPVTHCTPLTVAPGTDGGWWVIILAPATAGHVETF